MRITALIVIAGMALAPALHADALNELVEAILTQKPEEEVGKLHAAVHSSKVDTNAVMARLAALNSVVADLNKKEKPDQKTVNAHVDAIVALSDLAGQYGAYDHMNVVPKLIKCFETGDPDTNSHIERALTSITGKLFTDEDLRAKNKDPKEWGDRMGAWDEWWSSAPVKHLGYLRITELNKQGLSFNVKVATEANASATISELFKGLAHENAGVRNCAYSLLAQVLGKAPPFDGTAKEEERNTAISALRDFYVSNKKNVHSTTRKALAALGKVADD